MTHKISSRSKVLSWLASHLYPRENRIFPNTYLTLGIQETNLSIAMVGMSPQISQKPPLLKLRKCHCCDSNNWVTCKASSSSWQVHTCVEALGNSKTAITRTCRLWWEKSTNKFIIQTAPCLRKLWALKITSKVYLLQSNLRSPRESRTTWVHQA